MEGTVWLSSEAESEFNKPIGDWDISSVTDMRGMFKEAVKFNQDIGDWNTSSAKIGNMFWGAKVFNQDLSKWDISKVNKLENVFRNSSSFNQDISDWNITSVWVMSNIFTGTNALSNSNKGKIHESFSFNPNWPYDWLNSL